VSPALNLDSPLIVRLLEEAGLLEKRHLAALPEARTAHPKSIEDALIFGELAEEKAIVEAYATYLGMTCFSLEIVSEQEKHVVRHEPGEAEVRLGLLESFRDTAARIGELISEPVCRANRLMPLAMSDGTVDVVCIDPADFGGLEEVRVRTGCIVRPHAGSYGLVTELMDMVFGELDVLKQISQEDARGSSRRSEDAEEHEDIEVLVDLKRAVPAGKESQVVRIVNALLGNAVEEGASDIHIEPYEESVRVRYRVDGTMRETSPPPRSLFIPTISRLKILAKMDIAEKRIPQDGAIALKNGPKRVDLRVSTIPTVYGEKMVIRLLEKDAIPDKLEQLGFNEYQAKAFVDAALAPNGLMFVTGPTGSGKSTTLYTCLKLINEVADNIVTVEDPVEYRFYGLNQVQVRAKVGLTFASALRSFLRQDPDKIMVGEVRDQETAEICMRAALTGHLVLSTLHTNNSLQVINRLVDMGIEPFLLGPALRLLEAQRLARRLCVQCKEEYELPDSVAERHGLDSGQVLFRAGKDNCSLCSGSGIKGRVGIYEVIQISDALGELIATGADAATLKRAAQAEGAEFLAASARAKLLEGVVGLDEVSDFLIKDVAEAREAAS
jgi:type IV pilus assembly protein PilB